MDTDRRGSMPQPTHQITLGNHIPAVRLESEKKLGILYYISPMDFGWRGDIRKRYTDFLVNEVKKDGTVLHLSDFSSTENNNGINAHLHGNIGGSYPQANGGPQEGPRSAEPASQDQIAREDLEAVERIVGATVLTDLIKAYHSIKNGTATTDTKIVIAVVEERALRSQVHHEMRRVFSGVFETQADPKTGIITAFASRPDGRRRGTKNSRRGVGRLATEPGKDYLHFTLYKENKDTMDAINMIARMLRIKSTNFGFAGTKDRRAATTQRISVWRQTPESLNWLNGKNAGIKIGDFSYQKLPIQLGQHGGNEFVVTIKNVELNRGNDCSIQNRLRMTEHCVQTALDHVQKYGFINYFGLQRFGTHTIGTQEIGMKILSGDFEGAIGYILHVDKYLMDLKMSDQELEISPQRDEILRARAITLWKAGHSLGEVMEILPKRYNAEASILRHLERDNRDFCGALLQITRGLRNLYIHAYQSYVWNWVASTRWARYGDRVIKGDLILVESENDLARQRKASDMSEDITQDEEVFYQRARFLTAEEAASGEFTIFDVVLPVPGYDSIYPQNDIGDFYAEFMARPENGQLSPYNMRRRQREFSLSGHYRKLIARLTTVPKFIVRPYLDDSEQMHPTDLDDIRTRKAGERTEREGMRTASSSWRNPSHDDMELDMHGRRRAAERWSEPPETRTNDMWVESSQNGSNKRFRLDKDQTDNGTLNVPKTRTFIPHPEVLNGGHAFRPDSTVSRAASLASSAASHRAVVGSMLPDIPMPAGYHHATASEASGSALAGYRPTFDINVPGFPPPLLPRDSSDPFYDPNPHASRATAFMRAFSTPPQIRTAPVEPYPTPTTDPEEIEHRKALFRAEAAKPLTENVFRNAVITDPNARPLNLSGDWRKKATVEDMKIAVVLNFRLNASNYATICLRELMSSFVPELTPEELQSARRASVPASTPSEDGQQYRRASFPRATPPSRGHSRGP